jgi:NADPH2:quinone reductase
MMSRTSDYINNYKFIELIKCLAYNLDNLINTYHIFILIIMENKIIEVAQLNEYGGKIEIGTRNLRTPSPGELLIKVMSVAINPADLFFLAGSYGVSRPDVFPIIPGMEGTGEIVEVGEGVDKSLIGKRASFLIDTNHTGPHHGGWSQYTYASAYFSMIFEADADYDKITHWLVNPMTVVGMVDTVKKANVKAIVQDAASSALGKMLIRLCAKEGIETINLIRSEKHREELLKLGANYVINTTNEGWENELSELSRNLKATICFDAVGGDIVSKIFYALPDDSVVYNYGNLEFKNLSGFTTIDLIFSNKTLKGFWLKNWMSSITNEEKAFWWGYVRNELVNGDLFATTISKKFSLYDIKEALVYYQKNSGDGKVVLTPNI